MGRQSVMGTSLSEFLSQEIPPVVPLIEGVFPGAGNGFIGGESKHGKTFYALEEALGLAFGFPVCGVFTVPTPKRVLFIEEEDSPVRVKARITAMLAAHHISAAAMRNQSRFRPVVGEGFCIDDEDRVEHLQRTLKEFKPDVVYLDPLFKLTRKYLSNGKSMTEILATLDRLRKGYGPVFRVIHHFRKISAGAKRGTGAQELAGSFALSAWAEQSLFFDDPVQSHDLAYVRVQSKDAPNGMEFRFGLKTKGPQDAPTSIAATATVGRKKREFDDL